MKTWTEVLISDFFIFIRQICNDLMRNAVVRFSSLRSQYLGSLGRPVRVLISSLSNILDCTFIKSSIKHVLYTKPLNSRPR